MLLVMTIKVNLALDTADLSAHATVRMYIHGYSPALTGSAFVASHMAASTIEAHVVNLSPFPGLSLSGIVGLWCMGSRF
jgi:hypothetical protein